MPTSVAAITMAYNEKALLPIWLRHYGQQVGYENLFVIDHGSDDGSTAKLENVNLVRLERSSIREDIRSLTVSAFAQELLGYYDFVIFTDTDEMMVVDPLLGMSLSQYVARHAGEHTKAIGLNIVHNRFAEPPYAASLGVFQQRQYVRFEEKYSKPALHKRPMIWHPGFHQTSEKASLGVGLYLFHLRALDLGLARYRLQQSREMAFNEVNVRQGYSNQLRLDEQDYLDTFFPSNPDDFRAAEPASNFNGIIAEIAKALSSESDGTASNLAGLEKKVLTVPARFLKALPSADSSARAASPVGAGKLGAATAQELYERAAARVANEGWSFA